MSDTIETKKVRTTSGKAPRAEGERQAADDGRGEGRDFGGWRRRPRPAVDLIFDYKQIETIAPFIGEDGRMVPARVSRLSRKQQRQLTSEIKRARTLAMVPLSPRHIPLSKMADTRGDR